MTETRLPVAESAVRALQHVMAAGELPKNFSQLISETEPWTNFGIRAWGAKPCSALIFGIIP